MLKSAVGPDTGNVVSRPDDLPFARQARSKFYPKDTFSVFEFPCQGSSRHFDLQNPSMLLHSRVQVAQSRTHVFLNLAFILQSHDILPAGRLHAGLPPFAVGKSSQEHFEAFMIVIRRHVPGTNFWLEQPER